MAIDRIPGVGPTNADIATAVAAPSAATIASAVAAPSSSTIATAVAAAVPTSANITSIVQANAGSPFGGSWTYLGNQNPTTTGLASFTGLSGYKKYRLYFMTYCSSSDYALTARINNLSGSQYSYTTSARRNGGTIAFYNFGAADSSGMPLNPNSIYAGFVCSGYLDFDQASSGQYKTIDWKGQYYMASISTQAFVEGNCWVRETAAINRIDVGSNVALNTLSSTGFWLFGGN